MSRWSCCLIIFVAVFVSLGSSKVINLPDSKNQTIGDYLCNASTIITDDAYITFILQSNVTHIVSPDISNGETGSICLSTYVNSKVTITSDTGIATVLCTGTNIATRRGFAFSSMSFLKISNIKFEGCGGILSNPSLSFVNETIRPFFCFDVCQPAALLFHKCNNLTLSNIEVTNFLGFGVMLSNSLGHVVIQNMMVHDHIHHDDIIFPSYCNAIGSGILIMYNVLDLHTVVDITNCTITNCYNNGQLIETLRILSDKVTPDYWPKPVIGGSGLTGIFTYTMDQPTFVLINFNHLYVANNTGLEASAIVLLFMVGHFPVVRFDDLVTENNCVIDSGSEHYNVIGHSITAYISQMNFKVSVEATPLIGIFGSNFRMSNCGTLKEQGSTTEILIVHNTHDEISLTIENTKFNGITVSPTHGCGIALYVSKSIIPLAQSGMLFVQINNVTAYDIACIVQSRQNSVSSGSCYEVGIFSFANVGNVAISSGQFYNITGSSVITAMNSIIYLSQDPVFTNIKTESFGAINLRLNSFLYFKEPLNAKFVNNSAALGTAIYAVNDELYNDLCVFQFDLLKYYDETNYTNMSIKIYVENNVADLAGNLIYASPIEKCLFHVWPVPTLSSHIRNLSLLIKEIFTFNNSVSTTPAVICSCDPYSVPPQCINKSVSLTVYLGRNITIHVAAFNTNQQESLYALINAQYNSYISISHSHKQLVTALQQGVCTNLPYTIFYSTNANTKYPIYNVHLDISLYAHTPQFYVNVTLCPEGFQPADGGTCQCVYSNSRFTGNELNCNIENGSVTHPPSSWIGLTENKIYGYSSECPPLYCIANLPAVDLSNPDSLCYGNRIGTFCGTCDNNLSAVFGTADCQECSNLYLLTILGYAIAGLLLVILLFVLELTITSGTINGLIFYANVIGSNQSYLYGHQSFLLYLRVCISLINLELGFPLCFYNGMTQLVSTFLQFLFPVYIWIITVAIIYLSRYSIRLSRITGKRAVPVLVTLVYLSYSKIVTCIVNTLTVATIETVDGQKYLVWYLNGSLMYGHWPHIIPIILSLVMLILFVIPVTLLSTLAPFLGCIRLINRYMPLTDAVFAPYKNKWRFWFGLRIWLLMAALVITSFFRGNNIKLCLAIQLVLVSGFSLVQAFIQPFKNTAIEILDLFFMVNFALVAFVVVYVENETPFLHYSAGALVNMALVVFLCIIIFHFHKAVANPLIKLFRKNKEGPVFLDAVNTSINYGSTRQNVQVTEVQVQDLRDDLLREPVLNFTDS